MSEKKDDWQHWQDLPDEMEQQLTDRMAKFFVGNDLSLIAELFLESTEPVSKIFATMSMGLFGPYLEFLGLDRLFAFFRKQGNTKRLIEKIDELEDIKKEKINKGKD